jgi:photosystem II stability/assembly factor-like uncharacterized protein
MLRAPSWLVFLGCSLGVACGGGSSPAGAPRPPLFTSAPEATSNDDFAVFHYHPREPATLLARADLADGRVLYAGRKGERWVVDTKPSPGRAEAAADLAPEDLVAIVSRAAGGFAFVGKSGTTYDASAPLGPFQRSTSLLEPLVRVRASKTALIGVRRDGALVGSSDSGTTWSRVGPATARFEDVALAPDGHGLALAVPEALYESHDFGATWSPLETPRFGAESFLDEAGASLVVLSALGPWVYQPGAHPAFTPLGRPLSSHAEALGVAPPLGPSATALSDGKATFVGDRYLEVRASSGPGGYALLDGVFGQPLTSHPLGASKGCADVRIAGFGAFVYLACAREKLENVTQPVLFARSTDGGHTFTAEPYVVEGRTSELSMAVGADGALLVTGVCPSTRPGASGPGCAPVGVHVRRTVAGDAGSVLALVPSATPSLSRSAFGLAFSSDGKTAYAVGRRSKGESLAVFVSHDGGDTFEAHDVDALTFPDQDEMRTRRRLSDIDVESLAPSEDGTMAIVVNRRGTRYWLVVDDDGRLSALAKPPVEGMRLGAAGQRGLALNTNSGDLYGSFDAGSTWSWIEKLPVDACPGSADCTALTCAAPGCVFGNVLSRVGWRTESRERVLPPPSIDEHPRVTPRTATAFSCAVEPGEWKRIPGVASAPFAAETAIGKATWFAIKDDPATAAVSVVQARPGATPHIDEVPLLPPLKKIEPHAYCDYDEVEGVAAMRYALPDGGHDGAPLRDVEIAWDNVLEGKVVHAVIADAGPYRRGDSDGKGVLATARPALLSIASGGLYARLHAVAGDDQTTFFLDGRAVTTVPAVRFPPEAAQRGHGEIVHVGGHHVELRIDGPTFVRARRAAASGFAFDAAALGYTEPASFGLEQHVGFAYAGDHAGIYVTLADQAGKEASSILYPLRADGALTDAPIAVPTELDTGKTPRACNGVERSSTPRVVAPFEPGTRHPVLVTDPLDAPRVLLTGDAVLYGTPKAPCVASYEAFSAAWEASATTPREQAVLPMDDLEHAFLFRTSEPRQEQPAALEYRTMSCHFDPTAEAPPEVFRESGTLVEER